MSETLKAGTETDRLVADAVGGTLEVDTDFSELPFLLDADGMTVRYDGFIPSRNLEAAFFAAEKVGLFDSEGCVLDKERNYSAWRLYRHTLFGDPMQIGTTQETPALAICSAILKLKGNTE